MTLVRTQFVVSSDGQAVVVFEEMTVIRSYPQESGYEIYLYNQTLEDQK